MGTSASAFTFQLGLGVTALKLSEKAVIGERITPH